jgi:hypothetical protein
MKQILPPDVKEEIDRKLDVLREFNRKVDRIEKTKFWLRYENEAPNVIVKMDQVQFDHIGPAQFSILGRIDAWVEEFDQDEIEAFVLTFRLFTQDNDRISLRNLSAIYASDWLEGGNARECFEDARKSLNEYLDSAATIMFGVDAISVRSIVDIIIYGGLAHTNAEKSKIFESWRNSGAIGFIWAELFAFARHAVEILQYLRGLNAGVLEAIDNHGFSIGPKPLDSA